jgi:DNA-binding transcriptional ArsR family regulator
MTKNSVLIDLDDPRAAKIAEVMTNDTCKKILGLLAEGELSVGEISDKLGIPLNTASYNVD